MTWQPPEPHMFAFNRGTPYQAYTLDQLLAVRREAIEECAKVCSDQIGNIWVSIESANTCADAIRKLGAEK